MRYWFLRIAPRWELFASWSADNRGPEQRFFQVETENEPIEIHLWLGKLKVEVCRSP